MARSLPFVYAVEELGDALTERLLPILAAASLTPAQFSVLYALDEEGPMTLGELAKLERCVKSNISFVTRGMENAKLIRLEADPQDKRARIVSPTPLGEERFAIAKAGAARLEAALRKALGAKVLERLAAECLETAAAIDRLG